MKNITLLKGEGAKQTKKPQHPPNKNNNKKRRMFPLEKSTELRQMPEEKAGEKRRSSNSHLTLKTEPG